MIRYTPSTAEWHRVAPLNYGFPEDHRKTGGRWYPTLLTLANGNVLALSGTPGEEEPEYVNFIPEVFRPYPLPDGSWHRLGNYQDLAQRDMFAMNTPPFYPRVHLLPTGHVIQTTPTPGAGRTVAISVNESPWSAAFHDVCKFTPLHYGNQYRQTSVLLPLLAGENYHRRRLLIAGDTDAWMLDLSGWQPGATPPDEDAWKWKRTEPRALAGRPPRIHGDAVLLPTGQVLFVGGVGGTTNDEQADAVRTPEIFDPRTDKWSALTAPNEQAQVVRNYHSVALLMRDGRVWTAGSSHNGHPGINNAEMRIEVYEPWYHGNPNRPEILAAPDRWTTGEQFILRTTQASDIRRVAMVRTGSCTHAFNADQRYVSLKFTYEGGDILAVTAAPDGNIAPTGMYFLYTINKQGLPSDGITIYQSTDPASDVEGAWDGLVQD
ncbi:galactose oxidase-like domain-containing protein [Streptomyces virginiae]|uniref:galactose oxidase-like domain-containing protein n=1 Tax=Streptomyces virginiae TaxID=1961 RepID=UPI002F906A4A|nr:DUF1929 domain-containing protein [Streptomyces virginiae]